MPYHGSHCREGAIISPNLENRQSTNSTADGNRSRVNLVRCGESGRSIVTNKRSGGPPMEKKKQAQAPAEAETDNRSPVGLVWAMPYGLSYFGRALPNSE